MRLSDREFRAMNNPVRRFFQRRIEFPTFRRMGLEAGGKDVLEIGCGSGYGAVLLSRQKPRSYVGIDLMPEQIELARRVELADAAFETMDATDLSVFADSSKDLVVIFGILHHIPRWSQVVQECRRVLRAGELPIRLSDAAAVSTGRTILLAGGRDSSGRVHDDVLLLAPR